MLKYDICLVLGALRISAALLLQLACLEARGVSAEWPPAAPQTGRADWTADGKVNKAKVNNGQQ